MITNVRRQVNEEYLPIELSLFPRNITFPGITFADGPLWKEHRQFTVKHLKNVGFGKTIMETEIQREMQRTVAFIKQQSNETISPKNILASSVMNTLWKYAAGKYLLYHPIYYKNAVLFFANVE